MKKTLQESDKKQEATAQNSVVTIHSRTERIHYSSFHRQGRSDSSRSSVRQIRETFEKTATNSSGLKSAGSFHYHRSGSVKSDSDDKGVDNSDGHTPVSGKSEVCNITVCSNSSGDSGIGDTYSGGFKQNNLPASLLSAPVDPEKAQDRLVKSHSHIEQLQQNLATKLSSATVETFRQEYSPALNRHSHNNAGNCPQTDGKKHEKDHRRGHSDSPTDGDQYNDVVDRGNRIAVGPTLTNGNEDNSKSNRQSRVAKITSGKGDNTGYTLKRKKVVFRKGIFGLSVTKPNKHSDSHQNDAITSDETQGKRQFAVNSATGSAQNGSTQSEIKKQTRNQDSDGNTADVISQDCIERDAESGRVVPGQAINKDSEEADKGGNQSSSSPGDVNNSHGDCVSDASQHEPRSTEEPVESAPPPRPARVSWTTRLIQKLSEEELRKKSKSQTEILKPRRIVRFPEKKPPKVVKVEGPKVVAGTKKQHESVSLLHLTTEIPTGETRSGRDTRAKDIQENPSGVILDKRSEDAYASLISQLVDSKREEDSQQVLELKGEDLHFKQKNLEEIRATLAREECANTSSDDDSVHSVVITASTGNIEVGRRKEPKPSGIRRFLPQGLFVQKHRQGDRRDEGPALEPLLKRSDPSLFYPVTIPARPVLETAFLSDSESKLPMKSGIRQQQRSQSSSPSSRHKQASPKARRHQQVRDQTSIQENEQNSFRIGHQARSKSLSPARDRHSSSPIAKRTIPDTSLILEERLQHIRRELSSPPGRDVTRPSSATPTDRPSRAHQIQNSLLSTTGRTVQQEKVYENTGRTYNGVPSDAYYHSPPSRRRQQNRDSKADHKADECCRKASGGSSPSSTSTIVAESPPVSALSWNPLLLTLENQAISGSPDIRKLHHQRQQRGSEDSAPYGEIRNGVRIDSRDLVSDTTDSPDIYSHQNSGLASKHQVQPQVRHDQLVVQQKSPTSMPSGRLSAPPVASHYVEDYPRRRVISPEPRRTGQEYGYELSSRRSLSQPPRLREPHHKSPPQPYFEPVIPTDKRLTRTVGAEVKFTSSPHLRSSEEEYSNSKETQKKRNFILQQYRQLEDGLRSSPQGQYKKLSRQEVEALYWETQKFREGLSSLSQQISPHAPRLEERYHSVMSLPQQSSSAYRSVHLSRQNSPMLYQPETVPRHPIRTQSALNVGSGYGSLIVRPQPIYNNSQQGQASRDSNPRAPRARSASPGPNTNRHLSSRSLSLPRSIPATIVHENPPRRANDIANYFPRGVPQRNTIGPIRTSQNSPQIRQHPTPTIYEEPQQRGGDDGRRRYAGHYKDASEVGGGSCNANNSNATSKSQNYVDPVMSRNPSSGDGNSSKKSTSSKRGKKSLSEQPNYPPIFKRGSLISTSSSVDGVDSTISPKRVSFTSSCADEHLYWPTRNGPAPEPPTRQRKLQSVDSDVFLSSEEYSIYDSVPQAPNRPLPPVPRDVNGAGYGYVARRSRESRSPARGLPISSQRWQQQSESESGSEAGEVQRILQQGSHGRGTYFRFPEEEWGADGKARGPPGTDQSVPSVGRDEEVRRSGGGGGRSGRRDEPRRHTLSGDHHHHQQGGALARSMDLESPLPRGYPPPSSAVLFDEDPGIMSEVETSSTGFRRGGKQRSSLPVVRTPSKTLERPLGKTTGAGVPIGVGPMLRISPHPSAMATHHHQMVQLLNHHHGLSNKQSSATATSGGLVFLQYRSETKRALLPNEITSIDTVKALFVRSFPKQLTMEYLDSPHVKIYIHDSSKDMFYELEDLRSHLRDIRDRSVLRLFESTDMNGGVLPGAGVGVVAPPMWDQDQSYFSEPEFDSEYQHQHIHKTKASSKSGSSGGIPPQAPYYMTHSYPPGGTQGGPGASATLPRGGPLLRAYSPAVAPPVQADRIKTLPQTDRLHSESGYMSSPERGGPRAYPAAAYPPGGPGYEDPYYSQYASRSGSITPVIDEEASDTELIDESYSLYGVKLPTAGRSVVTPQPRSQFPAPAVVPYDATRIRVEHMERQLANLTGLVQKALTQTPTPREYLQVPPPASARDANYRNGV